MASKNKIPEPRPLADLSAVELEQLLSDMAAERASLAATIEAIPQRERELLDSDAPDDAFAALDVQRRRTHHRAERLNDRETRVLAALDAAHEADKAAAWTKFVDRYEALVQEQAAAGRALEAASRRVLDLTNEAAAAGFSPYVDSRFLRWDAVQVNQYHLDQMVLGVAALRNTPPPPPRTQFYNLRFLDWCQVGATAYMRGQEAGFTATEAWDLVRAQKAAWTDPTRIPPAPKARRAERRMPPNLDYVLPPAADAVPFQPQPVDPGPRSRSFGGFPQPRPGAPA